MEIKNHLSINEFLVWISSLNLEDVYSALKTSSQGLSHEEAHTRIKTYGANTVAREAKVAWHWMILNNFKNPFILVLILLGIVSYVTQDIKATIMVSIMVTISVLMRFLQEFRSSKAAEALRAMVRTYATVTRMHPNAFQQTKKLEIPIEELTPGDIIYLSAGDMIPADARLISSKDLFISQSALTGESIPIEKYDITSEVKAKSITDNSHTIQKHNHNPLECNNLCFMGTNVISGFGEAVVVATGQRTYFGSLAKHIVGYRAETSFDKGINSITWLLIRFIAVMVPIIFIVNGMFKGDWQEAFLFAIAVAVGLTPEMLPVVVTANLGKGAVVMSRCKVIVKRLNAIQSLGAMNILCTDKTGTLTQDKIILEKYVDTSGEENPRVLEFGFLNSFYQSGLKNMLDRAILDHAGSKTEYPYKKVDEIPFDFTRKRLSVVLLDENQQHLLICKGAVEEITKIASHLEYKGDIIDNTTEYQNSLLEIANRLNADGFRVIAVAYKKVPLSDKAYSIRDETDLTLLGLMAFLDPPKETAAAAIQGLKNNHVIIKVLTGDNEIITKRVCQEIGLPVDAILLGNELDALSDSELSQAAEKTTIFAKLAPLQKSRIIRVLQSQGHVVGFLGDGINDAPALRDADVGISVDSATDIAQESADIILLEKSLLVLNSGILTGREVYGNIIKYIKMTTSSNFGNALSVLIASAFLPFLPMLPLQLLIQNLFYDFSQLSLPWDRMDKEFLQKPRKWDPNGLGRFMLCMGPISSIFDMTTFAIMWHVFEANTLQTQALFQSGWFVEGVLSQTLIVHMIRTNKIPFIQSVASMPVNITTALIMLIALYLPFSILGPALQLVHLPKTYFIWLFATLLAYCALTQVMKVWYIKRFKDWL